MIGKTSNYDFLLEKTSKMRQRASIILHQTDFYIKNMSITYDILLIEGQTNLLLSDEHRILQVLSKFKLFIYIQPSHKHQCVQVMLLSSSHVLYNEWKRLDCTPCSTPESPLTSNVISSLTIIIASLNLFFI